MYSGRKDSRFQTEFRKLCGYEICMVTIGQKDTLVFAVHSGKSVHRNAFFFYDQFT